MTLTDQEYFERVKARCVVDANGCWLWQGFVHDSGYGVRAYRGKNIRVHRLMHMLAIGPIPAGMDVCHTCDVRNCVNPAHLWVGTRKQNMEDCLRKGRHDSLKRTHCPRGHELSGDNVYWSRSKDRTRLARHCKLCNRIKQRLYAGWTIEQAMTLPRTPNGHQPVGGNFKQRGRQRSEP